MLTHASLRHASARALLLLATLSRSAHADDPVAPSSPQKEPPSVPSGRRLSSRQVDELLAGTALFGSGYLLGAFVVVVPPLLTFDGTYPVRNAAEKRLALVPLAGPMWWWATANKRVQRNARDEPPCRGAQLLASCTDFKGEASSHVGLALPYAILATSFQTFGTALMIHSILRTDTGTPQAPGGPSPAPKPRVFVSPTLGGISMRGTF